MIAILFLSMLALRAQDPVCAEAVGLAELQRQVHRAVLEGAALANPRPWACLSEPLTPTASAAIFLMLSRQAPDAEDRLLYYGAALDVLRPAELDALDDIGVWTTVMAPNGQQLLVEGRPLGMRPMHRAALVQATDADGRILWTQLVHPGQALPTGFAQRPEDEQKQDGSALLAEVTDDLEAGRYADVIAKSIPAMSTFPEQAESFRAAADLAMSRLDRQSPSTSGRIERRPPPREKQGIELGFEAGFPTGARAEIKIARQIDSVGMRVGGTYLPFVDEMGWELDFFMDVAMQGDWQIEGYMGFLVYDTAFSQLGADIQWDPPNHPFQAQAGVGLWAYGLQPHLSTGFVW